MVSVFLRYLKQVRVAASCLAFSATFLCLLKVHTKFLKSNVRPHFRGFASLNAKSSVYRPTLPFRIFMWTQDLCNAVLRGSFAGFGRFCIGLFKNLIFFVSVRGTANKVTCSTSIWLIPITVIMSLGSRRIISWFKFCSRNWSDRWKIVYSLVKCIIMYKF